MRGPSGRRTCSRARAWASTCGAGTPPRSAVCSASGRISSPLAQQYIFTMQDLRKVYPPSREVLKGIWLSFYPGAKIGVLGLNGAGKSTILRIMAGEDQDFMGEARPAKGITVGYLPQEPRLDPSKDVLGNVQEGVA